MSWQLKELKSNKLFLKGFLIKKISLLLNNYLISLSIKKILDRDKYIKIVLKFGEGQHVEFKESLASLDKSLKTLAAFADQKNGGWLFFGVFDDGAIKKVQIGKNTIENIANKIKRGIISMVWAEPLIPEIYEIPDLSIIAIRVTQNNVDKGPYTVQGYRYKRSGKSTHKIDMNYKLLAESFNMHLHPDDSQDASEANYAFCPECGSSRLKKTGNYIDGDIIFTVICKDCGWRI